MGFKKDVHFEGGLWGYLFKSQSFVKVQYNCEFIRNSGEDLISTDQNGVFGQAATTGNPCFQYAEDLDK